MIYSFLHARPNIEWILQQLMLWTSEDHGAPTLQVRTVQRSGKIICMFKSSLELGAWGNPAELHSSKSPTLPSRDWGHVHPWHTSLCSVCVGCCSPLSFKLLLTTSWHLPSASTRIRSLVPVDLHTHWKEFRVETALCSGKKLAELVFRYLYISRRRSYEPNCCIFSSLEKH